MKWLIIAATALVILISISTTSSCIYEYREAVFYPNETQEVGRDWIVVNFTNQHPFRLYDVELKYRGESVYIPNVAPGINIKVDPYTTLPGEEFPLKVEAVVSGFNITYKIWNYYSQSIDVNVTIPIFRGFEKCYRCSANGNITFSASIPSGGSAGFTVKANTSNFDVPDGILSFKLKRSIPVKYGVDVQISVEKEQRGNKWYATFYLRNNLNRDVNVSFEAWYVINSQRSELFNSSVFLKAGENRSFSAPPVENTTPPVFYMRARAKISDSCDVVIMPATKNGNGYVVGYAILKGFSYSGGGGGEAGGGGGRGGGVVPPAPPPEVVPPPQPAQPPAPQPGQPVALPVPVQISINLPETAIPNISVEEATNYLAMMLPAAYGLFFATVLFPVMTRRGVVVSRDLITPQNYALIRAYGRRLYSTPSNAFPGCIVIEPDESIVERFMNLGLERKDAECVAVALKIKKPLITDSRKVIEIAAQNGCIVIPIRWT
ncbi:hypothetical protein [Archaeoglobus sp.]